MTGSPSDGFEIERKWLLHRLPARLQDPSRPLVRGAERWEIRQGYLPAPSESDFVAMTGRVVRDAEVPAVGRIREIRTIQGGRTVVRHVHTLKGGAGLVRREIERPITAEAFEAAWAGTAGRRLEKVRWRIPEAGLLWEIDWFQTPALALAEVEAIDRKTALAIEPPAWLAACIDREVTDDPEFTNAELAFRSGRIGGGSSIGGGVDSE